MLGKKSIQFFFWPAILLAVAACSPAADLEAGPDPLVDHDPLTPTPEIFNPLNPSPTPVDSQLPLTCQLTDLGIYVNEPWGYCFAYPESFILGESQGSGETISLYGPDLDDTVEPLRISLEITSWPVPESSQLAHLVDAYLASFHDLPWSITRETIQLGGEQAEKLGPVPGRLSSQVVMTLHNNFLYSLRFHPVDVEIARADFDALAQTVMGSFAFLEETAHPGMQLQTVSWSEFGHRISLTYDPVLAPWVEAVTVPAVPVSDQVMFAESRPTYAQFRFTGFQGGRVYDLPLLPVENRVAQVMVFQTTGFPGYGDDNPNGFVRQTDALVGLLKTGLDPARCERPFTADGQPLPFLPWLNSWQTFCAQPQVLNFIGGRGIRYLTYYSQGPGPALDHQIFYTFQGLTEDGQYYVSALFPVQTGIFPTEPSPCPRCGEPDYNPMTEWSAVLTEQLLALNGLPEDRFAPSLDKLDNLVESIQIGG